MATKISVNGKLIQRPGVYATTKSGIKNTPQNNSYGNILIIDDGIGAGFGGGSGINGVLKTGIDSVYQFDTIQDFQAFVKGGELWNLAKPLFMPSQAAKQPGVSKIFYVKAATTAPATISMTLTNGSFTLQTKDEGVNANGVVNGTVLTKGYGAKLIADPNISGNFIFQIWHGTYKGIDAINNIPYESTDLLSAPVKVAESPSFLVLTDLFAWFNTDPDVLTGFKLIASASTGNAVVGDISTNYTLAAGGTETFNSADFDSALAAINNFDFVHILAMQYGANAKGLNNTKLADFVSNTSKYDRMLVVAGGADKSTFASGSNSSSAIATYYNNERVVVVHGGVKINARSNPNGGVNVYSQLYNACLILGRCSGLPSQVPVSVKSIGVDGVVHQLSDAEQETAITKGVTTTCYDYELERFVATLDVNSLQNNKYLVNDDGTTYCWQLKRIEAELNKSIIIEGKKKFFDPDGLGGNRNTSSPEDVKSWLEGHLKSKTATTQKDGLIIKAQNIVAVLNQDNIAVSYEFVGNTEVKAILATGTLIEG